MALNPIYHELASHDVLTRDRGVTNIERHLASQALKTNFSQLDFLKIWKALFFCFWHSDKTEPQQALAHRFSKIVHLLPKNLALLWMTAFWKTMNREWPKIDVHRVDKFYSLTRYFFQQSLVYVKDKDWDAELLENFVVVLNPRCRDMYEWKQSGYKSELVLGELEFCVESTATPNEGPMSLLTSHGLLFHLFSLYIEELEKVNELKLWTLSSDILLSLLVPVAHCLAWAREKVSLRLIHRDVFQQLLGKLIAEDEEEDEIGPGHAHMAAVSDFLFHLGSSEKIPATSRAAIFLSRKPYEAITA